MDWMSIISSPGFRQWGMEFLVALFLAGGVALLAVGVGLIWNGAATLRFFNFMNRWISMRRVVRPLEIPHDTRPAVQRHRRWLAPVLIVGSVYAIYGLTMWYNDIAAVVMFGLGNLHPVLASWLVSSVRWILIAGALVGIVVGIMLAFFPAALFRLETGGGHWYSERELSKGVDTLHLKADNWVAENPRASGLIIIVCALLLIGIFGVMLRDMS